MPEVIAHSELRNLRRYAFSLLGNRALSDRAVETALRSFKGRTSSANGHALLRIALYSKVTEAVRLCLAENNVSVAVASGLHSRLLRLPWELRQVAALHGVMGLAYADVAAILDLREAAVRHLYSLSLQRLGKRLPAVLIIEDEVLIARELQDIVTGLGLEVAGMARNRAEALHIAGRSKPQIILADYKLKDDTGVDVVKAIRQTIDASVIYVTAHPEAVAAQGEMRDLIISKPFSVRAVQCAVETHLAA
jgi:CheY-like chemotaxis protein/DNA-directed RNA polymerase specialized sigma24 family protein